MADFKEITEEAASLGRVLGASITRLSNDGVIIELNRGPRIISILTGLHGNERVGPYFVLELLRSWVRGSDEPPTSMVIVPVVNDHGWDKSKRNWRGIDLNTEFDADGQAPHIRELASFYEGMPRRPVLHWDIHEDWMKSSAYVWLHKSRQDDPLNAELADHLGIKTKLWKNGDRSSEYLLRSIGVEWSATTEVPPEWDHDKRLDVMRRAWSFMRDRAPELPLPPLTLRRTSLKTIELPGRPAWYKL